MKTSRRDWLATAGVLIMLELLDLDDFIPTYHRKRIFNNNKQISSQLFLASGGKEYSLDGVLKGKI